MSTEIDIEHDIGIVTSINGSIIEVKGFKNPSVGHMVEIGKELHLTGEILKIVNNRSIIQCYEETEGLELFSEVTNSQTLLSMELGPGLLKSIYDGIQRPLDSIATQSGNFIARGISADPLDKNKKWEFIPKVKVGQMVIAGDIIGIVKEHSKDHCILLPPKKDGEVLEIKQGNFTIEENIYKIKTKSGIEEFTMTTKWPIRISRPYKKRLMPDEPLITGTRVFDLLFPVARGGAVAIPGGFGTGKTVVQHSLAKFADADIIVYIGCGERGNEMADLLNSFPELEDPNNGRPLMERTIMIANTSNMPVSAREASIFSGITIAEYWRDMGKDVLLLADSTSRWAEALREISGRLEEMPTEGGYPAYLADRLSSFYERAGRVKTLGSNDREGSITIVGAVSPPSGDFSEPVTSNTKRFVKAFWALDPELAYARHYPSVNPQESYSLYDGLEKFWEKNIHPWWQDARTDVNRILSRAHELQSIAKLVGEESLPLEQQLILFTSDLINNSFLIQNAFNNNDRYSTPKKTMKLIDIILKFFHGGEKLIKENVPMFRLKEMSSLNALRRARLDIHPNQLDKFEAIENQMESELTNLIRQYTNLMG